MKVSERPADVIARRLGDRKHEIEQVTLARVYGIAEPPVSAELDYLHGLREAVSDAIEFGLQVLSHSDERPPCLPVSLLVQARLAARNGVTLDIVLRRYLSGYTLFTTFVFEEANNMGALNGEEVSDPLRGKISQFDRLVSAIAEEYQRELENATRSTAKIQVRLVERLLAGEVLDIGPLAYDIEGSWHLALIFADLSGGADALRAVADHLDCRLLHVQRSGGPSWAWLGRREERDLCDVPSIVETELKCTSMAVSHPALGLSGWRLSHRQARAIYPLAQGRHHGVVNYSESGLLAAISKDEVLKASLRQLYIEPLIDERDKGESLKDAVRAYLAAGRNISSAASALGINRQTVRARLRAVEERIGCSLDACAAEIEIALRLDGAGWTGRYPQGTREGSDVVGPRSE